MHAEFVNQLIKKLSSDDIAAFAPSLERIDLPARSVLLEPNAAIDFVYFPENGVCSVLAVTPSEKPIEIGMFGCEGMSNFVVRPGDRSYVKTVVLFPGTAWRARAEDFSVALLSLPTLNEAVIRYKDACAVQFGYSAFAHGVFAIEERLARWILMALDRVGADSFRVTHDTVARMLSVRRSGVTTALHVLEGEGGIKSDRGIITVRDRQKLEEIAGECYGVAERAYRELMAYPAPDDQD